MKALASPQLNLQALAGRIQPQEGSLAAARGHQASVRIRLIKSFALSHARAIGSHARQTAVHRYSDVDFLVVLRKEEFFHGGRMVSSDTVLNRVVEDLRERFPQTSVRRDVLAASLDFGSSGQSLDVVPARFESMQGLRPVFLIPDGGGGWLRTSPGTHDRHFQIQHGRSGKKLSRVSQLLKWWKHAREQPLPIRSFYIDMLLCTSGAGLGVGKSYAMCLRDFFHVLAQNECKPIADPCGIAGRIAANDSYFQRVSLCRAAEYAYQHAQAAIAAEQRCDFAEANRQWSLVFNDAY